MDEQLKKYLQSVQESASQHKDGKLKVKEYLQSMEELKQWLKEKCDEDTRN